MVSRFCNRNIMVGRCGRAKLLSLTARKQSRKAAPERKGEGPERAPRTCPTSALGGFQAKQVKIIKLNSHKRQQKIPTNSTRVLI